MKINSENTNFNLRHLRAVHAIWQARSFKHAASRLGVVPSVLTETVRQLEDVVGAPLFDRRSRPVQPTPIALAFLEETAPLVEGFDRALERLRGSADLKHGTLRIGASPSAITNFVAPAIDVFRRRHPEIAITLHDDIAERLAQRVADGQLDLAVAGSTSVSSDLEQVEIGRDAFGLACRSDHPLRTMQRAVTLADIDPQDLVHLDDNTGTARLLAACPDIPASYRSGNLKAYSTVAQLCLIRAGIGIGLLPRNAVLLFKDPLLAFVEVEGLSIDRRFSVIRPSRRPTSHIGDSFVEVLLANLQNGLSEYNS